jgi:hypothetical protein
MLAPRLSLVTRIALIGAVAFVMVPVLVWSWRRMIGSSVIADRDGLRIYNGLATHVVLWSEVEGFGDSSRPFLLAVRRHEQRPITMCGLTPGAFGDIAPREEDRKRLEDLWRRATNTRAEIRA